MRARLGGRRCAAARCRRRCRRGPVQLPICVSVPLVRRLGPLGRRAGPMGCALRRIRRLATDCRRARSCAMILDLFRNLRSPFGPLFRNQVGPTLEQTRNRISFRKCFPPVKLCGCPRFSCLIRRFDRWRAGAAGFRNHMDWMGRRHEEHAPEGVWAYGDQAWV